MSKKQKPKQFWATATFRVGRVTRRGVDLREAYSLVRWWLILDGLQMDLTDFVFGK